MSITPKKATDKGVFLAACAILSTMEIPAISRELRRIVKKFDATLLGLLEDLHRAHRAVVTHVRTRREAKR